MSLRLQFIDPGEQLPLFLYPETSNAKPLTKTPVIDIEPLFCPVCGAKTVQENCKVICRSRICTYRIIYNCSEF